MDKTTFHQSSQSAILDAQTARLTLARDQANNFINGDTQFDPNILQRLDSAGFSHFLKAVRTHGVAFNHPPAPDLTRKTKAPSPDHPIPYGWKNQRHAEPAWIFRAIIYGSIAGIGLVAASSAGFIMFNA
jgi:hypothetical protein